MRAAVALGAAVACAGPLACYSARAVAPNAIAPGRRVSVRLTAEGTRTLASVVGPGVVRLDGDVRPSSPGEIVLALRTAERDREQTDLWQGQMVTVPLALVVNVAERRVDRRRTWIAALGAVAAAVATGAGFAHAGPPVVVGDVGGATAH